jgi:hypothetical protein
MALEGRRCSCNRSQEDKVLAATRSRGRSCLWDTLQAKRSWLDNSNPVGSQQGQSSWQDSNYPLDRGRRLWRWGSTSRMGTNLARMNWPRRSCWLGKAKETPLLGGRRSPRGTVWAPQSAGDSMRRLGSQQGQSSWQDSIYPLDRGRRLWCWGSSCLWGRVAALWRVADSKPLLLRNGWATCNLEDSTLLHRKLCL